jgi:hypothetical protein
MKCAGLQWPKAAFAQWLVAIGHSMKGQRCEKLAHERC